MHYSCKYAITNVRCIAIKSSWHVTKTTSAPKTSMLELETVKKTRHVMKKREISSLTLYDHSVTASQPACCRVAKQGEKLNECFLKYFFI